MTLEEAAACCPRLAAGVQPSLQALPAGHRSLIAIADTRRLQHSLDLEAALSQTEPRMKHWDYVIGWKRHSCSIRLPQGFGLRPARRAPYCWRRRARLSSQPTGA